MTRREGREQLFILLFQKEFYGEAAFEEQRETYFLTQPMEKEDKEYITGKLERIGEALPEIDEMISSHSIGWKIDRIGKEELAVLRLAVYEAVYDEDIPVGVAVNEAVELGKKYGEEGGASFINGILGNIVSDVPAQQGN